jgi:hypothetical protein
MEREELDIHIKELQAKAEAFFRSAGHDEIEVYRIEKFEPVRQDPQFLGKFYDGDSYVILKKNEKDYDIHYWHGKFASGVIHFIMIFYRMNKPLLLHLQFNFQTT